MSGRVSKTELFASLPPPWPDELRPQIRAAVAAQPDHKLVVLDDDPTGTQTVHDVPVLTTWAVATLERELAAAGPCFYILTNSRSLPPDQAAALTRELAQNLREAVWRRKGFTAEPRHARQLCCQAFTLVSRSDSTLRGHFPIETDVLAEELGPFDAVILIPYFEAGGRYTIHDTHYVAEGDTLVPAAETPFAHDKAFGYRSSHLPAYVEEKTGGHVKAGEVVSFSIEELRTGAENFEPTRNLLSKLLKLRSERMATVVVNACSVADVEFFALATHWAENAGGGYLFRTAAQFVAARLGLEPQPLWQPDFKTGEWNAHGLVAARQPGGLTIVGSYVPKTTEQLAHLEKSGAVVVWTLKVESLLNEAEREQTIQEAVFQLEFSYRRGGEVVLATSRNLIAGADAAASLAIGNRVSDALVEIVQRLTVRPRYLIAKGGITSSDLAVRGLGVKRALVRGQLLPGVPVWELGDETKFPGLPYIVFPGNVGGPTALAEAVEKLAVAR